MARGLPKKICVAVSALLATNSMIVLAVLYYSRPILAPWLLSGSGFGALLGF